MFSKELEQSIANLFDQAQDQNLEYLTIEHLLLMLISDFEVRQALETNDVNLATLRENLEEHVRDNTPTKVDAKKTRPTYFGISKSSSKSCLSCSIVREGRCQTN